MPSQGLLVVQELMVFTIFVFLHNAEKEIEGESNEKNKVLEQTPVVLIVKYMDLLHLNDSKIDLHNIKNIISTIVNMRNCDYVLEHTSLLEKIHHMMLPKVGHNLKWGLALLELFQSSTARKTIANYPRLLESLVNEVYNSISHDIGWPDFHIVSLLCALAEITTVAMKLVTSPSNFIPKVLELINARVSTDVDWIEFHDPRDEIYFQKLLNLVGILSKVVFQMDDNMTTSVFGSAPWILERLLLGTNVSLTIQKSLIRALTLIDRTKGNAFTINSTSPDLFKARGGANLILGLYKEALADFERALNHCENHKREQRILILR